MKYVLKNMYRSNKYLISYETCYQYLIMVADIVQLFVLFGK